MCWPRGLMVKALVFGTKDLCVRIAPWSLFAHDTSLLIYHSNYLYDVNVLLFGVQGGSICRHLVARSRVGCLAVMDQLFASLGQGDTFTWHLTVKFIYQSNCSLNINIMYVSPDCT